MRPCNAIALLQFNQNGVVIDCNEIGVRFFGYQDRCEMLHRKWSSLIVEDFAHVKEEMNGLLNSNLVRTLTIRHVTGSHRFAVAKLVWQQSPSLLEPALQVVLVKTMSQRPATCSSPNVHSGASIHITSKAQSLPQELQASEMRYRSLIESTDAAISTVDYDGHYLFVNGNAVKPLGKTLQELDRKEAEFALRASEKRYRQMFELHGLPKLIVDPETGAIVDANPAAGHFYGYEPAILKTLNILDINLSPREEVYSKMAKASGCDMLSCQFLHRGAGGQKRHVEVFTGPIEIEGKRLLYSIITDVTEKEQTKSSLQEANELLEQRVLERTIELERAKDRFEAIFNHSGDGILLLDKQYKVQQANSAFAMLFALTAEEYTGRQLSSWVVAEDASRFDAALGQVVSTGEKQQIEIKTYRSDGLHLDVEISIAPLNNAEQLVTNLVCIVRDISERKKAERAQRQSEHMLQSVIENIPVRVFWKDQNSIYRGCNTLHARGNGLKSPAEIIGKRDYDFQPDKAHEWEAADRQVMELGVPKLNVEELVNDADGSAHWLRSNKVALRTADGDVIGVLVTVEDITEWKMAELAISEERNLLRTVIDVVPDCIYVIDRQHHLVLNNQAHRQTIELYSSAEQIGKSAFDLYPPHLAAKLYADEEQVFQSQAPIINVEESFISADGDGITSLATKIPLRNLQGDLIGLVGITRDISELKANAEALRHSEGELRESQKKLQMVLDTIPVRVFWKDRDSVLQGCNRLFAQDAGFENVAEFLAHEQANRVVKHISPDRYRHDDLAVMETGHALLEYDQLFKRATGEELIVQTSKLPLRNEAGRIVGLLGVYVDITARRMAEQELAQKYEEEQEMQGYLKALHDVTLHLTQTETLDDFYYQVVAMGLKHFAFDRMGFWLSNGWNAEAVGTYGTDGTGQIINESHLKLKPQNLPEELKSAFQYRQRFVFMPDVPLFANGEQLHRGQRAIAALWHQGILGWLSIDNAVKRKPITKAQLDILSLYAITVSSLLTRKQAETALRESEEKFRIFIESAPIATFITDEKGTILLVNHETERLFGYKRAELLGQSATLLTPEVSESTQTSHAWMLDLQAKGSQTETIEQSMRRKNGAIFPADLQLRYIITNSQPLIMHLVIDITQRKQAELALRQSLQQEKELSQLKSHFVSMASHEFRTPLTTILSATETISVYRNKMTTAQIDARLDKIRQHVFQMRDIMEDVLHLERMQSGRSGFKPTMGDLDILCQKIIEEFEDQPGCNGRTIYSSDIPRKPFLFDEQLMKHVLNNLISNALKYSSSDKSVYVTLTEHCNHVQLTIHDQGIGIPTGDLKHLFEPFHRASNVGAITGTGLGLSIVKQAVELHNGTLSLESKVGVGTTFVVRLPMVLAEDQIELTN